MCHVCNTEHKHNHEVDFSGKLNEKDYIKALKNFELSGDLDSENADKTLRYFLNQYLYVGKLNYDVLKSAVSLKQNYVGAILNNKSAIELKINLDTLTYTKTIFSIFNEQLKYLRLNWREEHQYKASENPNYTPSFIDDSVNMYNGESVAQYLSQNITDEELANNALSKTIKVKDKTYNVGTKITKILTAIADYYGEQELKNKVVGNLRPQKQKSGIILSAHPAAFVAGGVTGQSCLSPEGDNHEGALVAIGYPNTLIAHTEDFSWRAWVIIDREAKVFSIFKGYPRENYYAQAVVYMYLVNLGYTLSHEYHFQFPGYMDSGRIWPDVDSHIERNRDAYYVWNKSFILDGMRSDTIIQFDTCESCERKFLNEYLDGGYCDHCEDDRYYQTCEVCGDSYKEDDMTYSEAREGYYCDHCLIDHKVDHEDYSKKLTLATASYIEKNFREFDIPEDLDLQYFYGFIKASYDENRRLQDIGHLIEFNNSLDSYSANNFIEEFLHTNYDYRGRTKIYRMVNNAIRDVVDYIIEN